MLRRQFLIGIAAVAVMPASASARRKGGFSFISKNDSPATRKTKIWLGIGGAGVMALVAIGRGVFWVMNRLEENPPPPVKHAPSHAVPSPQAATPVVSMRKTPESTSFGRRGR